MNARGDAAARGENAPSLFRNPPESRVRALLADCGLPLSDLAPERLEHFFGCGDARTPEGVVGLEIYGAFALLRSLAVAASRRGNGCGKALVAEAERHARSRGVKAIYLLTTTAERFFERLGYRRAERANAPEAIRRTREFSELCPASSAFMVKELAGSSGERPTPAGPG